MYICMLHLVQIVFFILRTHPPTNPPTHPPTHPHTHPHPHTHTNICHVCIYINRHVCMYVYNMYACICIYVHMYINTHTHIHTHTHTHARIQTQQTPTMCDEAGFGDIAKLIGQKWSEMTPASKQARVHIMLQEYM
jgi:hypothetical protein